HLMQESQRIYDIRLPRRVCPDEHRDRCQVIDGDIAQAAPVLEMQAGQHPTLFHPILRITDSFLSIVPVSTTDEFPLSIVWRGAGVRSDSAPSIRRRDTAHPPSTLRSQWFPAAPVVPA